LNPLEGSPLASYLGTGDPIENSDNLRRLMAAVYQTSFHPLIANAAMDRINLEADRYVGQSGREVLDPFYKTIQNLPGINRTLAEGAPATPAPGTPATGTINGRPIIPQEGKPYYCPAGSVMTTEKNGSGFHVCEIGTTGIQTSTIPR
jgi:hypothetical protein